ncbi:hypothetical protein, partial [Acetonema longum]|uniref:hypothetical protein n=1 Tax=Acetonema longum TaxID=2374 RepID=UPI001EE65EC2
TVPAIPPGDPPMKKPPVVVIILRLGAFLQSPFLLVLGTLRQGDFLLFRICDLLGFIRIKRFCRWGL